MPVPPFDSDGFLEPGRHVATAAEMKAALVDGIPGSNNRAQLFAAWATHLETLTYLIEVQRQWIGGSFVSAKLDPGDVDAVSFFDGVVLDALPEQHRRLIKYMCSGHSARPYWGCDAFCVAVYAPEHPWHALTEQAIAYWDNWWGHTRAGADSQPRARGYLEVSA